MSRIYIVDDDPDIVEILRMMLQTQGYQVKATTNPADILACTGDKHDLIMLDLWMSGIDGRDVFTRLREQKATRDIPVVFMSANSRLKEIAEEYEVDDYIEKPFDMAFMLDKIKDLLARNNTVTAL
jgi:DNA-binding response OmpR family regulator